MEAQARKHITVNETFRSLDALVQLSVTSRQISTQPESPAAGEGYILPQGKTGEIWARMSDDAVVLWQDNAWMEYLPIRGMTAFVGDEGRHVVWDGTVWTEVNGGEQNARLGVNTSPDDINRLSVKSDAVLFSHDDVTPGSGDMRHILNKSGATEVASLLFQSAFEGRVELGLTGSDDFSVRVSSDGINFIEAIVIDHLTGAVSFPNTPDLSGPSAPLWVPSGARFAISAAEDRIWTSADGEQTDFLAPAGASYISGSNPLAVMEDGAVTVAEAGRPRRTYDMDHAIWGLSNTREEPVLANGAPVPPAVLGMDLTFQYEVDPVSGNDSNSGAPGMPFATLTALCNALSTTPSGVTNNVLIRQGDYVDDPVLISFVDDMTGAVLVFAPGSTLRSTDTSMNGSTQGVDIASGQLTIYGNGLRIRDWRALEVLAPDDFQNSSNGVATHGTGTVILHDTMVSQCGDGLTAHADGRIEAYRCWVEDCDKFGVVHVNNATSYHEDCMIIGGDGHGGANVRAPVAIVGSFGGSMDDYQFVNCRLLPAPGGQTIVVGGSDTASFTRCQLGTYTDPVHLNQAKVTDCFVHFYSQINMMTQPMTRCFGKASIRLREACSAAGVISDCVFDGPAGGQPSRFLFSNYNPGSYGQITVTDCILSGYDTAIDLGPTEAPGYWQASGSLIESCTFFGITADFDTNAAAEQGTTITNTEFTDPGLGSTVNSEDMAEYAATSSTDGFGVGQVIEIGPPEATDDIWTYSDISRLGLSDGDAVRYIATDGTQTDQVVSGGTLTVPPGHWQLIHGPV